MLSSLPLELLIDTLPIEDLKNTFDAMEYTPSQNDLAMIAKKNNIPYKRDLESLVNISKSNSYMVIIMILLTDDLEAFISLDIKHSMLFRRDIYNILMRGCSCPRILRRVIDHLDDKGCDAFSIAVACDDIDLVRLCLDCPNPNLERLSNSLYNMRVSDKMRRFLIDRDPIFFTHDTIEYAISVHGGDRMYPFLTEECIREHVGLLIDSCYHELDSLTHNNDLNQADLLKIARKRPDLIYKINSVYVYIILHDEGYPLDYSMIKMKSLEVSYALDVINSQSIYNVISNLEDNNDIEMMSLVIDKLVSQAKNEEYYTSLGKLISLNLNNNKMMSKLRESSDLVDPILRMHYHS